MWVLILLVSLVLPDPSFARGRDIQHALERDLERVENQDRFDDLKSLRSRYFDETKKEATIERLRDLMIEVGFTPLPDMKTYSCRDYFNDMNNLLALETALPEYFDKVREKAAGGTPAQQEMLAFVKKRTEFTDALKDIIGLYAAFDSLEDPALLGDTEREKIRYELFLLNPAGQPGIPKNFTATQLNYVLKSWFQDGFSPEVKKAWVELTSIYYNQKLPDEEGAEPDLRKLFHSEFATMLYPREFLDRIDQYNEKENEFYALFGSKELMRSCATELLPAWAGYSEKCEKEANSLLKALSTSGVQKLARLAQKGYPKEVATKNCRSQFENMYSITLKNPRITRDALKLYDSAHLVLLDAPGKNGVAWNTENLAELTTKMETMPAAYRKKLPEVGFLNYQKLGGGVLGWYWSELQLFMTNQTSSEKDAVDLHTLTHELAHAWDYSNLRTKPELIDQWRQLGSYEEWQLRIDAPAAQKTLRFTTSLETASAYARYNEGEDFAETVSYSLADPSNSAKKLKARYSFVRDKILK